MQLELEQQQPYVLFSSSIRFDETRKTYTLLLKKFIEYLDESDIFLENDTKRIEHRIIDCYEFEGTGQTIFSHSQLRLSYNSFIQD